MKRRDEARVRISNTAMAATYLSWGYHRDDAEKMARSLYEKSGDELFRQAADVIKANGYNRKHRRTTVKVEQ